MARWFEDLTKTLGNDKIERRTAIRRIAGVAVGTGLTSVVPGLALARSNPNDKRCPGAQGCSNSFPDNCIPNRNSNCYCFITITGGTSCGCNSYCSQLQTCKSHAGCPKGYACIIETGCNCSTSQGVCIAKCKGKNKNCVLGSGHGATVAGYVL